jgi:hypothetical protein
MSLWLRWHCAWLCLVGLQEPGYSSILIEDRNTKVDAYRALLAEAHITASMSRTGNCYDNAVTESFCGTLKTECVEGSSFESRAQARQVIFEYTECFYNRVRRHSSLGYKNPVVYEQLMWEPQRFGASVKMGQSHPSRLMSRLAETYPGCTRTRRVRCSK